jgi:hypothetical protein
LHAFDLFDACLRHCFLPVKNFDPIIAILFEMGHRLMYAQGQPWGEDPCDNHKHGKLN